MALYSTLRRQLLADQNWLVTRQSRQCKTIQNIVDFLCQGCKTISKLKFKRHINACSGDKTVTSSDTFIQTTKRGCAEHIISRFNCNFYVLMNLHEFSYYKTFCDTKICMCSEIMWCVVTFCFAELWLSSDRPRVIGVVSRSLTWYVFVDPYTISYVKRIN